MKYASQATDLESLTWRWRWLSRSDDSTDDDASDGKSDEYNELDDDVFSFVPRYNFRRRRIDMRTYIENTISFDICLLEKTTFLPSKGDARSSCLGKTCFM